jgi:glyoxalase/bleomycin resistance protein/dioxygenase superfamily protein
MSAIVVRPVRFTDDVAAMQGFLETLGLRPRIEAEGGGWVDMVSGGGLVALHTAATSTTGGVAGATRLSFEVDDVDLLAKQLSAADVEDIHVYDEAYGRVLTCSDPGGDEIVFDERIDDLYGYRLVGSGGRTAAEMRVTPVRFLDPQGPTGAWLEVLGLQRIGEPNDFYVMYAAGGGDHGYVGLRYVYSDDLPIVPGPGAVQLTFSTLEPLDVLATRLRAAGYEDATVVEEDFGGMLSVTDPDGSEVQVHEAPTLQP